MNQTPSPTRQGPIGPIDASSCRLLVLESKKQEDALTLKTIQLAASRRIIYIALCDEWQKSQVQPQDIVRVVLTNLDGSYQSWESRPDRGTIVVTRNCNIFILHPDTLISGTTVADSFVCIRKSVLSGRVPQGNIANTPGGEAALFGSMIHDLFQTILALDSNSRDYSAPINVSQTGGVSDDSVFQSLEKVVIKHTEELYACNVSEIHAKEVLRRILPEILDWYTQFMGHGDYRTTNGVTIRHTNEEHTIIVTEVHDIEELIWSPIFGIKGKIDASIQFQINGQERGIGVFELKTGKSTGFSGVSHTAQVTLYTLLLSHRYNTIVNQGLLTYVRYQQALKAVREAEAANNPNQNAIQLLQTQAVFEDASRYRYITSIRAEVVGMLMQRNELASYLRLDANVTDLPPLLKGRESVCKSCFFKDSCLIQHKILEQGSEETAAEGPGAELFREKILHLTHVHAEYYSYWRKVLANEHRIAGESSKEIWTMRGAVREANGRCLSNLMLIWGEDGSQNSRNELLGPNQRINTSFKRHNRGSIVSDFRQSRITPGAFVVISAESLLVSQNGYHSSELPTATWQSGLTNGFVASVGPEMVTVTVDRSLLAWANHQHLDSDIISWRIDTEEIFASHSTAKRTLEQLFINNGSENIARLRALIVDRDAPQFDGHGEVEPQPQNYSNVRVAEVMESLNSEQQHALNLSFHTKDYMLILGMPGTGKSTTLTAIVLAAAIRGKSVLLCSHTNSAVDNLLCKLLDLGFTDFIRLGRSLRVIKDRVHPYHVSKVLVPGKNIEQLEREMEAPRVVATTCLGINHPLFLRRSEFDLVVIDEASQILQPICIGPLQFAKGPFILVGDHYQLPPLQRSNQNRNHNNTQNGDMVELQEIHNGSMSNLSQESESLFRRLSVENPSALVSLSKQYRMATAIMSLSNELFYGGTLSCATNDVASQRLDISTIRLRELSGWRKAVRNPSFRIVFLDVRNSQNESPTRNKQSRSSNESKRENMAEANIILESIILLTEGGLNPEDITVLSMFRAQVSAIHELLKSRSISGETDISKVEVCTVDEYQGKDNKCIIVSFVRNNNSTSLSSLGPLLGDWRRINVTLTRAKQKLILVGHAETFSGRASTFTLRRMMNYLQTKRWVHSVVES